MDAHGRRQIVWWSCVCVKELFVKVLCVWQGKVACDNVVREGAVYERQCERVVCTELCVQSFVWKAVWKSYVTVMWVVCVCECVWQFVCERFGCEGVALKFEGVASVKALFHPAPDTGPLSLKTRRLGAPGHCSNGLSTWSTTETRQAMFLKTDATWHSPMSHHNLKLYYTGTLLAWTRSFVLNQLNHICLL